LEEADLAFPNRELSAVNGISSASIMSTALLKLKFIEIKLFKLLLTSSSAIAERPRCRVGRFWPKVKDEILQTI